MSLNMNYWLSEELQPQEKEQLNALLGNVGQTDSSPKHGSSCEP